MTKHGRTDDRKLRYARHVLDGAKFPSDPLSVIRYPYEMYPNSARMSVSVATIEFPKHGDGTGLVWTEQGAYLDGIDEPAAPKLREEGTAEMLDELTN